MLQKVGWYSSGFLSFSGHRLVAAWHKFNPMPAGTLPIVPAQQRLAEEGNGNGRIGHQILAAAFESEAQKLMRQPVPKNNGGK